MPDYPIDSPSDARLDPYRDLKQRSRDPQTTFVAEGEKLVRRLLASGCGTQSILCNPSGRDRIAELLPADVPVYVASTAIISALVGFQFHRGLLACGFRPPEPTLDLLLASLEPRARSLVVLCPEIRDPENLGTIIRTAAAFGASGMVVGRSGTDPFSRRVLRTSMGSVLRLPLVPVDDWPLTLDRLHRQGAETVATLLDPAAEALRAVRPAAGLTAILLGNESAGLPAELAGRCRRRVMLPMAEGVDSLNVAVAAGIILHHFSLVELDTGRSHR